MLRPSFRLGLTLGLLSGAVWALRKASLLPAAESGGPPSRDPWTPVAAPPPAERAEAPAAVPASPSPPPTVVARLDGPATQAWVEGSGKVCPETHPIKAKLSSRIYHLPGMVAYNRTVPDRCYPTEEAAQADGFTRAKR